VCMRCFSCKKTKPNLLLAVAGWVC
jgi:hypothetical protein